MRTKRDQPGGGADALASFDEAIDGAAPSREVDDDPNDVCQVRGQGAGEVKVQAFRLDSRLRTRDANIRSPDRKIDRGPIDTFSGSASFSDHPRFSISDFMNAKPSFARVISSVYILRQILVAAAISGSASPKASITSQAS